MSNQQQKAEQNRLRAMLAEDLESDEEAAALLPVIERLRALPLDQSGAGRRSDLVNAMRREMRARGSFRPGRWWPLLILRAQVRLVQREIWLASALMFLLGLIVSIVTYNPRSGALILTLFAPVIAAAGMAFLYSAEIEEAMEIERALPLPLALIVLARMTLVFAFDAGLGIAASLVLASIFPAIPFWPLVWSWLVPMTFLSALAFFVSVIGRDTNSGMAVSLALWMIYTLFRMMPQRSLSFSVPVVPAMYPWMLAAAAALIGAALWIVERGPRTRPGVG